MHGARAVVYRCKNIADPLNVWVQQLVVRRGTNKACVALAARMARLSWVLLQRKEMYRPI